MTTVDELLDDFSEFEDWQDRYRYLLELGDDLPDLPEEARTDENLVQGCQSRVWLIADVEPTAPHRMHLVADSDSAIVRGLIALLVSLYDDRPAGEVGDVPIEEVFAELGLGKHLTPARSNGFRSMVARIGELAGAAGR